MPWHDTPWEFIPFLIAATWAGIERMALLHGMAWVYRIGVPLRSESETVPFRVPDVMPEHDYDDVCVTALGGDRLGLLEMSSSVTAGGSRKAKGMLAFGVMDIQRAEASTTFRFRSCATSSFFLLYLTIAAVPVFWALEGTTWEIVIYSAPPWTGFWLFLLWLQVRRLRPLYHLMSADLVRKAAAGAAASAGT